MLGKTVSALDYTAKLICLDPTRSKSWEQLRALMTDDDEGNKAEDTDPFPLVRVVDIGGKKYTTKQVEAMIQRTSNHPAPTIAEHVWLDGQLWWARGFGWAPLDIPAVEGYEAKPLCPFCTAL